MIENIEILHTNDIHSHFEYWPRIHRYLTEKRKNKEGHVYLFDIGDHMDRFHPYTDGTLGKGNVQMLNDCKYDAVTIGNNEGITLAHEDLMALYENANFDCILANLYQTDGSRPYWAKPYKVFETNQKTKIGIIGVTINYSNFYSPLNWQVTDPFDELDYWIPIVKEKSDIVIVLSHLGLSDDERIAEKYKDVDIVLGGHTHHILPEGKKMNNTLLRCTGKHGQYIGKVELSYNHLTQSIVKSSASLISTEELTESESEKKVVRELNQKGKQLLSAPVACLEEDLEANWYEPSLLNQILCAALTEWCEADCSFINAGILLDGLKRGIVTKFDIHRICPHPINPCTVHLTGAELKEVLLQTLEDQYTSLELKGFGFRGKVFGKIIYDRIQFEGAGSSIRIKIDGIEIEPEHLYTIATIDIFTFARFYPPLTRCEKKFYLPEFIRDVLTWKLAKSYPN